MGPLGKEEEETEVNAWVLKKKTFKCTYVCFSVVRVTSSEVLLMYLTSVSACVKGEKQVSSKVRICSLIRLYQHDYLQTIL